MESVGEEDGSVSGQMWGLWVREMEVLVGRCGESYSGLQVSTVLSVNNYGDCE